MAIKTRITDDFLIIHECSGELTLEDFTQAFGNLPAAKGYRLNLNVIWDIRNALLGKLADDEIFSLSSSIKSMLQIEAGNYKVAFVVSDDLGYGLAHMYKSYSSSIPIEISIFRSWDDAYDWVKE